MGRQADETGLDPGVQPGDDDDEEDNSDLFTSGPLCAMDMVEGRLVARTLDPEADAQAIIATLDASDDREDPTDGDDEEDVLPQSNASDAGFETDNEEDFPSVEELLNSK